MKSMLLLSLTSVITLIFLLTGCSKKGSEGSTLKVGLSADFAPFAFIEEGKIQGFDIDLMQEVAKRLHKEVSFQDLPFETLIPELAMGKLDLVAGGMSPTPERAKRVLFSKVYLEGEPVIALAKASETWINEQGELGFIEQARVVVCMGYSSSDDYVTGKLKLEPIRLNNLMECLLALKTGQVDLLVGPRLSLMPMLAKDPEQWRIHLFKGTQERSALLISPSDLALKKAVDKALDEMEQEGIIQILKAKWGIL